MIGIHMERDNTDGSRSYLARAMRWCTPRLEEITDEHDTVRATLTADKYDALPETAIGEYVACARRVGVPIG